MADIKKIKIGNTEYNVKDANAVTSVNNVQPVNGNVSLNIPTVDQTYSSSSANAQSGTAVAEAIASGKEIFIATYETTTYQEVSDAYNAGKAVYCKYTSTNQYFYIPLVQVTSISFIFCGTMYGNETLRMSRNQLSWSLEITQLENVSNKVVSISSSSTNTQYPSAKCVYDALEDKADTADLNGKADTDLSNVPTSKSILSESYVNGTSWYRVYSDGWCEQGGYVASGNNVTYLKPYLDTNYTLVASGITSSTNSTAYRQIMPNAISETGFTGTRGSGVGLKWYACGYIN